MDAKSTALNKNIVKEASSKANPVTGTIQSKTTHKTTPIASKTTSNTTFPSPKTSSALANSPQTDTQTCSVKTTEIAPETTASAPNPSTTSPTAPKSTKKIIKKKIVKKIVKRKVAPDRVGTAPELPPEKKKEEEEKEEKPQFPIKEQIPNPNQSIEIGSRDNATSETKIAPKTTESAPGPSPTSKTNPKDEKEEKPQFPVKQENPNTNQSIEIGNRDSAPSETKMAHETTASAPNPSMASEIAPKTTKKIMRKKIVKKIVKRIVKKIVKRKVVKQVGTAPQLPPEKKKKEEELAAVEVDVVRADGPSKTVPTANAKVIGVLENAMKAEKPSETQVVRISENPTMAENHPATVETLDNKASGISDNFVKAGVPSVKVETADKDTTGTPENPALQKLLHMPRHFNPSDYYWETCYSCGLEGHTTKDCSRKQRKKWCFVCGKFGHAGNRCPKAKYCHNCNQRGHLDKDCRKKHLNGSQDEMCLRCGDAGHDMSLCINDYPPDDMKRIQCYVCKSFGHLCCLNIIDTGPREISCYNCGQLGHSGILQHIVSWYAWMSLPYYREPGAGYAAGTPYGSTSHANASQNLHRYCMMVDDWMCWASSWEYQYILDCGSTILFPRFDMSQGPTIIVFHYPVGVHNVFKVNGTAFQECIKPPPSEALISGNDTITLLTPGLKWYICGVGKHCEVGGQKLDISVQSISPAPAPAPSPFGA